MNKILYGFLFLVVLTSLSFYYPTFIPLSDSIYKLLFYGSVVLLAIIAFYSKKNTFVKSNIDTDMKFLLICQLISVLSSYVYKGQSLGVGLLSTFQNMAFVVYFILRRASFSPLSLTKLIQTFATIHISIVAINILVGHSIFGRSIVEEFRGTRYIVPGLYWVIIFLYYKVNQYSIYKQKKDILWIIVSFLVIASTLTRQVILVTAGCSILIYITNSKFSKKLMAIMLLSIIAIFVLPQVPFVQKLVEKTLYDIEANQMQDNIRLQSFEYFAFDYPRNSFQYLFGCGVPAYSKSSYGIEFQRYTEAMGFFRDDVGWAGFFFTFGLLATILLASILVKPLMYKISKEYLYLKYFILSVIVLSLASGPILHNNEIVVIVVALYLLSIYKSSRPMKKS